MFDFVGNEQSIRLSLRAAAPLGSVVIVGMGGSSAPFGWSDVAPGVEVVCSMGSPLTDIVECLQLVSSRDFEFRTQLFPFDRVDDAYGALRRGTLEGRAVITMPP